MVVDDRMAARTAAVTGHPGCAQDIPLDDWCPWLRSGSCRPTAVEAKTQHGSRARTNQVSIGTGFEWTAAALSVSPGSLHFVGNRVTDSMHAMVSYRKNHYSGEHVLLLAIPSKALTSGWRGALHWQYRVPSTLVWDMYNTVTYLKSLHHNVLLPEVLLYLLTHVKDRTVLAVFGTEITRQDEDNTGEIAIARDKMGDKGCDTDNRRRGRCSETCTHARMHACTHARMLTCTNMPHMHTRACTLARMLTCYTCHTCRSTHLVHSTSWCRLPWHRWQLLHRRANLPSSRTNLDTCGRYEWGSSG